MPLLTDPSSQDPQDMRGAVRAFPDHLAEGWRRGAAAHDLGLSADGLDGVVLCGMGGSAIGGDLVRTLVERESPVPVAVNRDYGLPGWVGASTHVIVSSYSGGTEETLSAYAEARARGARVVVVTSGGEVAATASEHGHPALAIPGGLQPRAALGYSLGVGLQLARALGLVSLDEATFGAALDDARARSETYAADADGNAARDLSAEWEGALPVVYTAAGLLEAVGMRWRTQIHENAKHPAVGNVFPELDHNEIMGFEAGPPEVLGRMRVVVLRDEADHPQVVKRYAATRALVEPAVGGWREVHGEGGSPLGRVLSLVQLGDWASVWLALRKGVDPTPVETIQALKRTLAGGAA